MSVAFAVVVPLVCRYVLRPGQKALDHILHRWDSQSERDKAGDNSNKTRVTAWIRSQEAALVVQTALLILLIIAADYSGASILLAAYLAGVVVSWWDGQRDDSNPPPLSDVVETHASAHVEGQSQDSNCQTQTAPDPHVSGQQGRVLNSDSSSTYTTVQVPVNSQTTVTRAFDTYYGQVIHRMLKPFFFVSNPT